MKLFTARYAGFCTGCSAAIEPGDRVLFAGQKRIYCSVECERVNHRMTDEEIKADNRAAFFASMPKNPGDERCDDCSGTGTRIWGAIVNGVPTHSGVCFRCQGKGKQSLADRRRNFTYDCHRQAV